MSENTKIEWADHTFNPWEGCQKVGPGCDHCYAENRNARFGGGVAVNWGPGAPRRRTSLSTWSMPRRWNAQAEAFMAQHGRRQRVFCSSLADVFDNAVDPQWRLDLLQLIADTPDLDWLLLTKRIGNAHTMLDEALGELSHGLTRWEDVPWPNVWIGATIVNQEEADRDIPKLLQVPAAKRFLSIEPLLGPVGIWRYLPAHCERHPPPLDTDGKCEVCEGRGIWWSDEPLTEAEKAPIRPGLDWVIVGGESGPNARPMSIQWARELRDQCANAGTPFLFKQWGEWAPARGRPSETPGRFAFGDYRHDRTHFVQTDHYPRAFTAFGAECIVERVGKKAAGRQIDGRTWDEVPK